MKLLVCLLQPVSGQNATGQNATRQNVTNSGMFFLNFLLELFQFLVACT